MAPPKTVLPDPLALWVATTAGPRARGNTLSYARIVNTICKDLGVGPESAPVGFFDSWLTLRASEGRPVSSDTEARYRYAARAWERHRLNPQPMAPLIRARLDRLHPAVAAFSETLVRDGAPPVRVGGKRARVGPQKASDKAAVVQRTMIVGGIDNPHKITPAMVQTVLDVANEQARDLGRKSITPTRRNEIIRAVEQFWLHEKARATLEGRKLKWKNPTIGVERAKREPDKDINDSWVCEEAEALHLIECARDQMQHHPDPQARREGRIILTMLVAMSDCAMRFESALLLDGARRMIRCHTDPEGNRSDFLAMTVEKGSDGDRVAFPITEELYDLLRAAGGPLADPEMLRRYATGPPRGWRMLTSWCRARGVPDFEAHGLRRMAAIIRYRETRDIMAVADLLRDTPAVAWTYLRSERGTSAGAPVSRFGRGTTAEPRRLTAVHDPSAIAARTVMARVG